MPDLLSSDVRNFLVASSPWGVVASHLATRTSWVLDALSNHQPSSFVTLIPSISTKEMPCFTNLAFISSTMVNFLSSEHWKRSSGVLCICAKFGVK